MLLAFAFAACPAPDARPVLKVDYQRTQNMLALCDAFTVVINRASGWSDDDKEAALKVIAEARDQELSFAELERRWIAAVSAIDWSVIAGEGLKLYLESQGMGGKK